jgi:bile acid-coenzyme A ligase
VEGLSRGLHVITMRRFDAARGAELISRHRPHWALFVPTMMNRLLKLPAEDLEKADFRSLTHVWHSAAYCPAWLKQAWIDLVGPEAVWEIFGGSEGCSTTIINGAEWLQHKGSVGRPFNGEIAIFDENGNPVPAGVIGEIYMRDPGRPRRFQVTAAVKRRMLGDWESFGDLGWLDEDGYLFLADRRVDMINAGGQNIYPAEVEAAIQSHPAVADAVVFGQPDDDLGEIVAALVWAPDGTLTRDALLEYLATQIVRYKIPRRLAFADGPIRNDAGKVRKAGLAIAPADDGKLIAVGNDEDSLVAR